MHTEQDRFDAMVVLRDGTVTAQGRLADDIVTPTEDSTGARA